MSGATRRVVVVGGGTAGWLAALIIQDAARRAGIALDLTMVESSRIPTIGVGEGSTAVFRQILLHLGLDELEFLRETEATIKYGIRHKDWRRVGVTYDGPIDDPHLVSDTPPGVSSSWLNQYCVASGRSVADPHLFRYLLDRRKAPFLFKDDGGVLPVSRFHHAFHFDQSLVGGYLRSKAQGIELIDAQVTGVTKHPETGHIETLVLDDGDPLPAEFVIDCTGFRRALIAGEMGGEWVSYANDLPVNRAMPFWVELEGGEEINPYTLAWARDAGWMWSIPTQARYGCGYVYCDRFKSPDEAQAEIETALGHPIEPRADIRIDAGRLDRAWIGNCLAVGLSSSFLEPLEATSIHGTIVQLLVFTQFHLKAEAGGMDRHRKAYNETVARQVDDFRSFINLHYATEREDTEFWRFVRAECIHKETRDRLALWADHMPRHDDFKPFPGGFAHIEEQLYYPVLDGLGHLDRNVARAEMAQNPTLRAHARKTTEALVKEFKRAARIAPGHRAFLDTLAG